MGKLLEIARDMERSTAAGGTVTRRLSRGLEISLTVTSEEKTLTLRRPSVPPSPREVVIVRGSFGVPNSARTIYKSTTAVVTWPTMPE